MSLDNSVKPRAKLPAGWIVQAQKTHDGHDDGPMAPRDPTALRVIIALTAVTGLSGCHAV
jgi:hypothetical protein